LTTIISLIGPIAAARARPSGNDVERQVMRVPSTGRRPHSAEDDSLG